MSIFSAAANLIAGNEAADAQKDAAMAGAKLSREQYQQTRSDLAPFREAGTTAFSNLRDLLVGNPDQRSAAFSLFQADPGADYADQRATDAVTSSNAARGIGMSGSTLSGIADRVQNNRNQGYQTYLSRLFDLGNVGQTSAAQTGNFGAQSAAEQGRYLQDAGAYRAQQQVLPALAWQQWNPLSGVQKAIGGAFGGGNGNSSAYNAIYGG